MSDPASNFDKNEDPNDVSPVNGLSLCTARVCPGVVRGSCPTRTDTFFFSFLLMCVVVVDFTKGFPEG